MGSVFRTAKIGYYLTDDPLQRRTTIGFHPNLFENREWIALRNFCSKRNVSQKDLNTVFRRYLDNPEGYMRNHKMQTNDLKQFFIKKSQVLEELAHIFMPTIFLKEYHGLDPPSSVNEVSFSRFIIMSYLFCARPMPDLICDFFGLLRMKYSLHLTALIYSMNFQEIAKLICEDLEKCSSLWYILHYCNPSDVAEYNMEMIVRWSLKYPLFFYTLARFQHLFRRLIFGDGFWNKKRNLKSELPLQGSEEDIAKAYHWGNDNERAARRETAMSIIADIRYMTDNENNSGEKILHLSLPTEVHPAVDRIDESLMIRMKDLLGYKVTRGLILESEIPYSNELFLQGLDAGSGIVEKRSDHRSKKDFVYNATSGRRQWITKFVDSNGIVVKEMFI